MKTLFYTLSILIVLSIFGGIIVWAIHTQIDPVPDTMIATPYHTPVNSECEGGGCNLK